MRRPSAASLKRVTAENLIRLGPDRLASLLIEVGEARAEWKRRLRIELAAAQGVEHLAPEIDKRVAALETSRGRISHRQRSLFLRELGGLRILITDRMAPLDRAAALDFLWRLLAAAPLVRARLRHGEDLLSEIFADIAQDAGRLIDSVLPAVAGRRLAEALQAGDRAWPEWIALIFDQRSSAVAVEALSDVRSMIKPSPFRTLIVRALARAAQNPQALLDSFSEEDRRRPAVAADLARQFMHHGEVEKAGDLLRAAMRGPKAKGENFVILGATAEIDFDWETSWLQYLEQSAQRDAAQEVRWASFLRTLDPSRLRDFLRPLADFEDVEAEYRAFEHAATFPGFRTGLRFLMEWPAFPEAAKMIELREAEMNLTAEEAEAWAAKLQVRFPRAANLLLRKAAARAFARRDFATCDRLTAEADHLGLDD